MTIPTEQMTIQLPASAVRRLRRIAEISQRSVDEVIASALSSSLPPLLEDVPDIYRGDLIRLESLSTPELWQEAKREMSQAQQNRYDELLLAQSSGKLDPTGRDQLAALRVNADGLMFSRAYALVLLKWRGERVPSLAELDSIPPLAE